MELLVATLANMFKGNQDEAIVRARVVLETVKNAPGMMNARAYSSSRDGEGHLLVLTAWEDEELWQKAQERYNPKTLMVKIAGEMLTSAPEQWWMHYLWGYSRPSAQATMAEVHLATVQSNAAERVASGWLDGLRHQALSPTLAFAFLARGDSEGNHSSTFLNLLSWPGEMQRREFYADQRYMALRGFLNSASVVRILTMEPV